MPQHAISVGNLLKGISAFLKSFDVDSVNWNMHQCHGLADNFINITCDENDKVIALTPYYDSLPAGTIPTELAFLSDLGKRDLRRYLFFILTLN